MISPILANRTLDGLQQLLRDRFGSTPSQRRRNKVHLVRYADDFLITGTSRVLLQYEVQPLVEGFLAERGLELSHEKTHITHIEDGFDFLGQHIRRYRDGKVIIQPSVKSVRSLQADIRQFLKVEGGRLTAGVVIEGLNSRLHGWADYHRHVCSKRTFAWIDSWLFRRLWNWARRRHNSKGAYWVRRRYFHTRGGDHWVFTGIIRDQSGKPIRVWLYQMSSTPIRRHVAIRGVANPYDPSWELYFEERSSLAMRQSQSGRSRVRYLWLGQDGKCVHCGQPLDLVSDWHVHHRRWRVHGGEDHVDNLELLHSNCHRQIHSLKS